LTEEIYELFHPETKAKISQTAGMNRAIGNNVSDKMSSTSNSFAQNTAEKFRILAQTVENSKSNEKSNPRSRENPGSITNLVGFRLTDVASLVQQKHNEKSCP